MIVVKLTMMEGRTVGQKAELARRLTEAAARHFGADAKEVRVVVYEVPATNWATGGIPMSELRKGR